MKLKRVNPEFWTGLPPTIRQASQFSLFITIISFFSTLFFTYAYFYEKFNYSIAILVCFGFCTFFALITLMLIGRRAMNYYYGHGWYCECGTKIGFGDISEAFRISGKLGNLTKELTAYVTCDACDKHTLIEWSIAYPILVEELENFISTSETKVRRLSNSNDSNSKLLIPQEEQFIRRSKLLLEKANSGKFLSSPFPELHSYLTSIADEYWNFDDRETLYETMASIEAYWQIKKKHEVQGINLLSGIYKHKPLDTCVENINSFSLIKDVSYEDVKDIVIEGLVSISEKSVKNAFEDILCEPLRKKDWAGEYNDIYSTTLVYEGERTNTAFMLKGPGTTGGLLQIGECGKNGDQIVRLFESPAKLFIIQAVGNISEQVIKDVESKVRDHRSQGKEATYCLINGQDTARILRAYGKV